MIRFMTESEVSSWLRKHAASASGPVAIRAALRSLPTFAYELSEYRFGRYGVGIAELAHPVLLPTFRALMVGWFASAYPERHASIAPKANFLFNAAVKASYRDEVYSSVSKRPPYERHWIAASMTAAKAMRTFEVGQDPPDHAGSTIENAATFDEDSMTVKRRDGSTSYRAAAVDAEFVEGGASGAKLAAQPLWLFERPEWNVKGWDILRDKLAADNEDWSVWIKWYEARCSGQPSIEPLESARAAVADEFWLNGPRAVNREIQRLETSETQDQ
jgi:hypothetical protein